MSIINPLSRTGGHVSGVPSEDSPPSGVGNLEVNKTLTRHVHMQLQDKYPSDDLFLQMFPRDTDLQIHITHLKVTTCSKLT
jgi:hypothetical protein